MKVSLEFVCVGSCSAINPTWERSRQKGPVEDVWFSTFVLMRLLLHIAKHTQQEKRLKWKLL